VFVDGQVEGGAVAGVEREGKEEDQGIIFDSTRENWLKRKDREEEWSSHRIPRGINTKTFLTRNSSHTQLDHTHNYCIK